MRGHRRNILVQFGEVLFFIVFKFWNSDFLVASEGIFGEFGGILRGFAKSVVFGDISMFIET